MLLKNIIETVLDNGLKVVCLRKSGAPIVSVQVWYKTGSGFETDGNRGISHFLEHMMFRGSENVKPEEHAQKINDIGGHCNAFTAEDVTAYTNSVPAEFLDMVLRLEADRIWKLRIDSTILETERKVIIEEFHTHMNSPLTKAFLEFRQEFYRNHPYAMSPLGSMDDLVRISVEQCNAYHQQWYTPRNAIVVIVGDIDESDALAMVKDAFESIPSGAEPAGFPESQLIDSSVVQSGAHRMNRRVDFDVPMVIVGYPAPPFSHEDAMALEILQMVVSGGETSRLHREVVRRQSVAVMAGGMNHLLKHSGMSMLFAAFTPDTSVARVEKALRTQISIICEKGVSETEMQKVRNATLTNRTFELYSAENICQRIGYSEAIEGNYRLWVERIDALKVLDRDRLIAVARKYWDDSLRHVLYLQPKRTNVPLFIAGLARRLIRIPHWPAKQV